MPTKPPNNPPDAGSAGREPDRDATFVANIARLANAGMVPFDHPGGGKASVLPPGHTLEHLPPVDPPLTHLKQRVELTELKSFTEYVTAFRADPTRVFVTVGCPPEFQAVLDYHLGTTPGRCDHHATFQPLLAEEWKRWAAIDGKLVPQNEFAEFIEENARDIATPTAGEILDVVANLKARRQVAFESGVELQSGAVQLVYSEQIEGASAKSSMEVPARLTLGIPMFFNGTTYEVTLLLRYRIGEGKLRFQVKMLQRAYIERDAVAELVDDFRAKVPEVPVAFGRPVL